MRLVYLDESARDDRFYFFGALIADAAAVRHIEESIDKLGRLIATNVRAFDPHTEFHAVEMFQGKGRWESVPVRWRIKACDVVAKILAASTARFVFRGVDLVAQRSRYARPFPAHLLALAHTLEDVHMRLGGMDEDGLGLVLADEHHSAGNARRSLRSFKLEAVPGYTTRTLECIADTLYFGPSCDSRMLQAADIATYFLNRHRTIEERDPRSARVINKIVRNIRSVTVSEYIWRP